MLTGDALMDKEQRLAERAQNCGSKKGSYRQASKLADKTRRLNARKEDLDGRDEALALRGLEARRAQVVEAREAGSRRGEDGS